MSTDVVGNRIQFVTGAGGAGRTTVAAATAQAAARDGVRTALITAAAEHVRTLGELGVTLVTVDQTAQFQDQVTALQHGARGALDQLGAQPLDADELTELPGAEAFALLRALRTTADLGEYELVVVDLPQVADAIRLLALPDQLRRYLTRLLPAERQAARALRPVLAQLAGVPMPAQWLYESAERWRGELKSVAELVESLGASAVLVVEPGAGAVESVASARSGLALGGTPVEAVFVNRMFPDSSDSWLATLAHAQRTITKELRDSLAAVPVLELPHLGRELSSAADLAELAVPAPTAPPVQPRPWVEDRLSEDREFVWRLPLPGAVKERLTLVRRGDEAIVTVGPYRRALPLSAALCRCTVAGARLAGDELTVRFAPDPALWPKAG